MKFKEATLNYLKEAAKGSIGIANEAAFSCMEFKEATLIGLKGTSNKAAFSCMGFKKAALNERKRRGAFWQDALLTQG